MTEADLPRALRVAREMLVRAQPLVDEGDAALLQGAIDRVELVGGDLPDWPKAETKASS